MKENKKIKKLKFRKETIAQLGEWQMSGVLGGTAGGNNSVNYAGNPCTLTLGTKANMYTCNVLVCKKN